MKRSSHKTTCIWCIRPFYCPSVCFVLALRSHFTQWIHWKSPNIRYINVHGACEFFSGDVAKHQTQGSQQADEKGKHSRKQSHIFLWFDMGQERVKERERACVMLGTRSESQWNGDESFSTVRRFQTETIVGSFGCNALDCSPTRLNVCHEFLPALRPRIWIMKAQTNARAHKTNKRRKRSSCILRARFCSLPEWASALDAASVISVLIRLFKILDFFSVLYCACVGTKRNRWNERKKQT